MFEKTTSPLEKKRAVAVRALIGLLNSGGPDADASGDLASEGGARAQAIETCAGQVAQCEAAIKDLRGLGRLSAKRAA